jgi:AcrR family transcriptional regulator
MDHDTTMDATSEADPATIAARGRTMILDAALDLFTSQRYGNVSVEAVCERAGVQMDDFDASFASKFDLLKQLADEITNDLVVAVIGALDEAPPGLLEQLYAGMGAFTHAMLDDERRTLLIGIEVLGIDPDFDLERRDVRILFAEFIAQIATTYQDQGIVPKGVGNLTYMGVAAAIFEIMVTYALPPVDDRPSLDDLIVEAVRFMKAAIITPEL